LTCRLSETMRQGLARLLSGGKRLVSMKGLLRAGGKT